MNPGKARRCPVSQSPTPTPQLNGDAAAHTPGPWTYRDAPGAGIQISATLPRGFMFDHTGCGADGITQFMTFTLRDALQIQVADERWVQFETSAWSAMQKANAARIVSCVNACEGINPEAVKDLLRAQTMGQSLNTPDFLDCIASRLVEVYGEPERIDFVLSLRARAAAGRAALLKATGGAQ